MPIRSDLVKTNYRGAETIPSITRLPAAPLSPGLILHLMEVYKLAPASKVTGLELDKEVDSCRTTALLECQIANFNFLKDSLIKPMIFDLPTSFSKGVLEVKPQDSGANKFEATVCFEGSTGSNFRYRTDERVEENVHTAIERAMILASLSEDVSKRVRENGNLLVIVTNPDLGVEPKEQGLFFQLTWKESENVIEAQEILSATNRVVETREEMIRNNNQIFFIMSAVKQSPRIIPEFQLKKDDQWVE